MTADRLATLARRAAADPGDVQAQAEWLRARVRAGELPRERVELAAYCGHAGANSAVGYGERVMRGWPDLMVAPMKRTDGSPVISLNDWLRGLARWGDEVMVRAAVAAADSQCNMGCIDVVAENEQAIACARNAVGLASDWLVTRDPRHRDGWAQEKDRLLGSCVYAYVPHPDSNLVEWLVSHGRLIGKQPVREAIQRALIAWALGELRRGEG